MSKFVVETTGEFATNPSTLQEVLRLALCPEDAPPDEADGEVTVEYHDDQIMADGGDEYDPEMDEERLERLADSPLVELILACEDVVGAARVIEDNEYMWDRLTRDVARNSASISSEDTAEEVITETINQMERYGSLGKRPEAKDADMEDEDQ